MVNSTEWTSVRGLRLQNDAQMNEVTDETRSVWRLAAEDPKLELSATSDGGQRAVEAVLALARACLTRAG